MTKEEVLAKHLKGFLEDNHINDESGNIIKRYSTLRWILNAMDEWGQLQVNKNLHKPAVGGTLPPNELSGWSDYRETMYNAWKEKQDKGGN